MKKGSKKIVVALCLILGGVSLLIIKGVSDTGVYYRTVAETLDAGSLIERKGVRISGEVVGETINFDQTNLLLTFTVRDLDNADKTMNVTYRGVKPDAFKQDSEVILEGRYDRAETMFNAETLLAKCPSKYESETERGKE